MASREEILEILKTVSAPSGEDIVAAGVVRALGVADSGVRFVLEVPPGQADKWQPVKTKAEEALAAAGVGNVHIAVTA
ncbi:iron-sulfur cluster assembly protein, partial [Sagittula stellata]